MDIAEVKQDIMEAKGKGEGIIGMRERARLIGGTIIVQSEKGAGTTVTLRIPA